MYGKLVNTLLEGRLPLGKLVVGRLEYGLVPERLLVGRPPESEVVGSVPLGYEPDGYPLIGFVPYWPKVVSYPDADGYADA